MSFTKKPDSSGKGSIISGSDWATRIHKSNDPLNPWWSITEQETGKSWKGWNSSKDYIDSLLPDCMKEKDGK